MKNQYPMMARFNQWANLLLYRCTEELHEHQYNSDQGLFFGSVHNTLNHLLLVDELWMGRIKGKVPREISSLDRILFEDFQSLKDARIDIDAELIHLVDGFSEQELEQHALFSYLDHTEESLSTELILSTLFNHQTHHRGQINAVLTKNKIFPPDMDILDFVELKI
ncbi:MAG: DinB family protein [bacterium]